jgi:uncharacterized protein (TIGR03000 family)
MLRRSVLFVKSAVLIATAFLLVAPKVQAQDARGYRSQQYPWSRPNYQGYNDPPSATPPSGPAASPQRYTVHVTVLPQKNEAEGQSVLLIAHLPENARLWIEDVPMPQQGTLRQFLSPPLTPGQTYTYTIRVQWLENGQWVSQMHRFPVHGGDIHCIDIVPKESAVMQKEVAANLAKLDAEDRKAAEAQRFCAVQEGIRLGTMGVPVKVMVKSQPVFLCCEWCVKMAQGNPEQTLEQVKKIQTKKATSSSP